MRKLIIIQARIGSTRLPNKVMQTVSGIPMVKRVWLAAKHASSMLGTATTKVVVAWPERYPDLDENNVLERFRRLAKEFKAQVIIRLTADCPLITSKDIVDAVNAYLASAAPYYNNRKDGHDVQVFPDWLLFTSRWTDKEHVISDVPNTGGDSVNTKSDLERVRGYAR